MLRGAHLVPAGVHPAPVGVPLRPEGKPISAHVSFSDSWPASQGTVRSLSPGVPTISSSTAGQFFLPTGTITSALSTADVGRWANRYVRQNVQIAWKIESTNLSPSGYLAYDMIHYYIHYGSPSGGHLYHMKRYHYQHHFVHHDLGKFFTTHSPHGNVVFSYDSFSVSAMASLK